MAGAAKYAQAGSRVIDFLAGELDDHGAARTRPDDVQYYYKMPAVLAYGGRRTLALRALKQFEARFFAGNTFDLKNDPIAAPWAAYLAGWIAWGAGSLGQFDLARRIMTAVSSRQDMSVGGFTHQSGQNVLIDTERSSAAAMGCIWATFLDKAGEVARFLGYALDHQPKPGCFFTYFDTSGRALPDLNDRNAYFALNDAHARPAVFACSIASLVWLGRATGETRYFDLAHRYMQLVFSHTKDAAVLPLATKTGWAALMLRRHVADDALSAFAQRSGDDLVARVQADGSVDFNGVIDVPKPIDKVWLIGWGCDVALTLLALADGTA